MFEEKAFFYIHCQFILCKNKCNKKDGVCGLKKRFQQLQRFFLVVFIYFFYFLIEYRHFIQNIHTKHFF